jgi:hypothetical protein
LSSLYHSSNFVNIWEMPCKPLKAWPSVKNAELMKYIRSLKYAGGNSHTTWFRLLYLLHNIIRAWRLNAIYVSQRLRNLQQS